MIVRSRQRSASWLLSDSSPKERTGTPYLVRGQAMLVAGHGGDPHGACLSGPKNWRHSTIEIKPSIF
jgi:hypothetical protein